MIDVPAMLNEHVRILIFGWINEYGMMKVICDKKLLLKEYSSI